VQRITVKTVLFLFCLLKFCCAQNIELTDAEIEILGAKIFQNECGGKAEYLAWWNEGEEFASLGIGHFLWYPKDFDGPFEESFPKLLIFLKEKGVALPAWLQDSPAPDSPWDSRTAFFSDSLSQKMRDLKALLLATKPLQALFIAQRLEQALPKMLAAAAIEKRAHIRKQFYRMANSPNGMYPLIDYVNFKGEGVLETERYHGEGWGLLQVLGEMQSNETGKAALQEFADAAKFVLERRVKNSPPERNEQRWIPGWFKRIETYVAN
jgi:hypothetical protein